MAFEMDRMSVPSPPNSLLRPRWLIRKSQALTPPLGTISKTPTDERAKTPITCKSLEGLTLEDAGPFVPPNNAVNYWRVTEHGTTREAVMYTGIQ